MRYTDTGPATALDLDARDELREFRKRFVPTEADMIYRDGNSLGRRIGIAPIYTGFEDIFKTVMRIKEIVENRIYNHYSSERKIVT